MGAEAKNLRTALLPDDPTLADMLVVFRRGSMLVDAALSTLAALTLKIDALRLLVGGRAAIAVLGPQVAELVRSLGLMLQSADVGGDNLLLVPKHLETIPPLVVFTLARQASGSLSVQSIEIDRAAVALSDGHKRESCLTFDRIYQAAVAFADPHVSGGVDVFRAAFEAFVSHTMSAASRLSIAKARFDLQSSFLSAVTQTDAGTVYLEGHLNATGARDMAMETRRLLSRESMNIANGNVETLRNLLQRHAAKSQR